METPPSTVVDEVPYAEPADILNRYIRNRDEFTDPGEETVYSMLLDRSDFIDERTDKAWRRRRVEGDTTPRVKFSPAQKNPRKRKRARYSTSGRRRLGPRTEVDPWVDVQLPLLNVTDIETLKIIRGRNVEDITSEGPSDISTDPGPVENGEWWIQADRGRLKIDLRKFIRGGRSMSGRLVVADTSVRVTYVYGNDESANVNDGETMNDPSDSVPGDLSDACAKLVAADIAETDQYGALFREGGEDVDLGDTAANLRNEAMDEIKNHRRR